jgi:glycosyltransferase involved in cell wall biosynthesis
MRIALLFRSYGPYHLARLEALRRRASVLALEFSDFDTEYDWNVRDQKRAAGVVSLSKNDKGRKPGLEALTQWLQKFSPDVVAIPGYSEPLALLAACICRGLGIPAILMSDSHSLTRKKNPIREACKRSALTLFHSAFVAGTPQVEYLAELGFPRCQIATGYDVVDNTHFVSSGSPYVTPRELLHNDSARNGYFLCCSRFVKGKNLILLIDAFKRYRSMTTETAWPLVIAGDGPLYSSVAQRVTKLALTDCVHLVGRKSYDELPALYASAGAFVFPSLSETWGLVVNEAMAAGLPVLVSNRVGCHRDLVCDGVNGYVFNPENAAQLATLLCSIANAKNRQALGEASLRIIREWDTDRFASGMIESAIIAYSSHPHKKPRVAAAIAAALLRGSSTSDNHGIPAE